MNTLNLFFAILLFLLTNCTDLKTTFQAEFIHDSPSKGNLWHPHLKILENKNMVDNFNQYYPVQLVQIGMKKISKTKMSPKQDCKCKFIDTIPVSGSFVQTLSSPVSGPSSSLIQKNSIEANKNFKKINEHSLKQVPHSLPNFENINKLQFGVKNQPIGFSSPNQIQHPLLLNNYQPIPLLPYNYQNLLRRKMLEKLLIDEMTVQTTNTIPYLINNQFYPYG